MFVFWFGFKRKWETDSDMLKIKSEWEITVIEYIIHTAPTCSDYYSYRIRFLLPNKMQHTSADSVKQYFRFCFTTAIWQWKDQPLEINEKTNGPNFISDFGIFETKLKIICCNSGKSWRAANNQLEIAYHCSIEILFSCIYLFAHFYVRIVNHHFIYAFKFDVRCLH